MKIITLTTRQIEKIKKSIMYNMNAISYMTSNFDDFVEDDVVVLNFEYCNFIMEITYTYDEEEDPDGFHFKILSTSEHHNYLDFWTMLNPTQEDIITQLDTAISKFKPLKFCDCNRRITNEDFDLCECCYVNTTNNEEKCPICLENGMGLWVRNGGCRCVNYYHKKCLDVVSRCPTCRSNITSQEFL